MSEFKPGISLVQGFVILEGRIRVVVIVQHSPVIEELEGYLYL